MSRAASVQMARGGWIITGIVLLKHGRVVDEKEEEQGTQGRSNLGPGSAPEKGLVRGLATQSCDADLDVGEQATVDDP